jgi:signal transduction histidine kinase
VLKLDDRQFGRLAVGTLTFGFLLLILALAAGALAVRYNERSRQRVIHTYRVMAEISKLELATERMETASRGYLLAPDPERADTYRRNAQLVRSAFADLVDLTSDNPVQRGNVAVLRQRLEAEQQKLAQVMALAVDGNLAAARQLLVEEIRLRRVIAIRAATAAMGAEEARLMKSRTAAEDDGARLAAIVLGSTAVILLLLALCAIFIVRRYTADLTQARNRLHLLNTDLEGAVAERTSELSRANDEIQRFAYIVSHDLRSPLVNVMGFTSELDAATQRLTELVETVSDKSPELLTEETKLAVTEDLPEAIGFIRSSTQKMDRLINAILKLSREGRRTLAPEKLVMTELVETIRDTLEHRLQTTGSEIVISSKLPNIISDRVAIEQLFSNLIENAVKYLKPGVPGRVEVNGRLSSGLVVYDITDNGRGIDAKDHQRIFDLFRRSGQQDQPGEGIGLAHVRALAYRLGGTVEVTSTLGEGATFHLSSFRSTRAVPARPRGVHFLPLVALR